MPSKTEQQRRFMAAVYAYKTGKSKEASPEIKKAAQSMSEEQVRDFLKKQAFEAVREI